MLGKNTKQIAALMLLGVMAVSGIIGCSTVKAKKKSALISKTSVQKVKLSFLCASDLNLYNEMVEKFKQPFEKKYSNTEIELNLIDTKQLFDKLIITLAAGDGPDIVSIDSLISLSKLTAGKSLVVMDGLAEQHNVDFEDYNSNIIQALKETAEDGKVYMLPYSHFVDFLVYNKKMFEQYGIELPKKDISLEELFDTAMKLNEKIIAAGDDKKDIRPFSVWAPGKMYTKIMQAYGEYMYDASKVKLNYESPLSKKAMKYEFDLYDNNLAIAQPEAKIKGYPTPQDLFPMGYSPMMLETGWTLKRILRVTSSPGAKYKVEDFDVLPWPMFKGDKPSLPSINCNGYGITKDSKNPEEAFLAVSYLTNEFEKASTSPTSYGLNARNDSLSNVELLKLFPGLKEALNIKTAELPKRISDIDKLIDSNIKQNFDQASVGQLTYIQLEKKLNDEGQKIINEYKISKK